MFIYLIYNRGCFAPSHTTNPASLQRSEGESGVITCAAGEKFVVVHSTGARHAIAAIANTTSAHDLQRCVPSARAAAAVARDSDELNSGASLRAARLLHVLPCLFFSLRYTSAH